MRLKIFETKRSEGWSYKYFGKKKETSFKLLGTDPVQCMHVVRPRFSWCNSLKNRKKEYYYIDGWKDGLDSIYIYIYILGF